MKTHVVKRMLLAIALAAVSVVGMSAATYAKSPKQQDPVQDEDAANPKNQKATEQKGQNPGKSEPQKAQQPRQPGKQQQASHYEHKRNKHQQSAQRQQQNRLSDQQQRQRVATQQQRLTQYGDYLDQQQRLAEQHAALLRQQNRTEQYRFQQQYQERLRDQQLQLQNARNYDYDADPYFHTAPTYRYSRGGRSYETNQYGADLLRQAVNYGYEEGFRAAQADRSDGWRSGYKDSYAYRDANYGYNGFYVKRDDYNHYFREGFSRGYGDGYDSRDQYGSYEDGKFSVLDTVLALILDLQPLR